MKKHLLLLMAVWLLSIIPAVAQIVDNTYINMITIMRPDQTDDQEETPTGINTIDNTSAPLQMKVRKIMEDGRIVIEKNGNKYTTTGIKI